MDAVTTTQDGRGVILTCQDCGAVSARIPITPVLSGVFWCGLCGEWGFDFDLAGLTDEQAWPATLDLVKLAGPLGPDGADNPRRKTELVKITPKWTMPEPKESDGR